MNFEHRFIFRDLERTWALCTSEAFMNEAYNNANADVTWLNRQTDGEMTRLVCEVVYRQKLPSMARQLLKKDRLTYELIQEINEAEREINWQLRVRGSGSKVRAVGKVEFQPQSSGCVRVFTVNVIVELPIIGKVIAKEAIKRLQKGQDDLCALLLQKTNA